MLYNAHRHAITYTIPCHNIYIFMPQVLELPRTLHDDIAEQHVFLLIGTRSGQQTVQLLPDSPGSQAFLKSLPTDVFFWQEDRATGDTGAIYSVDLINTVDSNNYLVAVGHVL